MSSCSNLHCPVLYSQGTKGSPGQAGPAGEQGMRGPQVSEFTAEERPCLMMLWCYFITDTSPKNVIHRDCWDLGIFGCAVAWLSLLPLCSHQPRCDVFAKLRDCSICFPLGPGVFLPMCADSLSFFLSTQGPPGQIGTPGIRGEQGVPGPRVILLLLPRH